MPTHMSTQMSAPHVHTTCPHACLDALGRDGSLGRISRLIDASLRLLSSLEQRPELRCAGMCADVRPDVCRHVFRHVCRHVFRHVFRHVNSVCVDMCVDMCTDMHPDARLDVRFGARAYAPFESSSPRRSFWVPALLHLRSGRAVGDADVEPI